LSDLSEKYNNRKSIHKSEHHRMWNQPNKLSKSKEAKCYLQSSHKYQSRKEILHSIRYY